MADQPNQSPDHVAAADLIDRLSCAVDYDYATDDLQRKHYPCLRDDLGDLHHDLLNAPNTATARVVEVIADATRAAVVAELKRLADEWNSVVEWWRTAPTPRETSDWHAPSVAFAIQSTIVTVRQRIVELEAGDA